jgi:uncharacterized membrane protein HdeD (DUF308 family)
MRDQTVTLNSTARSYALGAVMVSLGLLAAVAPVLVTMGPVGVMGLLACMAGGAELMFSFRPGPLGRSPLRFAFGAATLLGGVLLLGGTAKAVANPIGMLAAVLLSGAVIDAWLAAGHDLSAGRQWLTGNALVSAGAAALLAWQGADAGLLIASAALGARLLVRGLTMEGLGAARA